MFDEFYTNAAGSSKSDAKAPRTNADKTVTKPNRTIDKDVAALGFGAHAVLDADSGAGCVVPCSHRQH